METLYDLLGALPRDDADELRAAFRRAVKGVHPDLNPGDPDAGQKFRELVRANEILSDEDQRAAYDHLLDLAHKEQTRKSTANAVHKIATSVIALSVAGSIGLVSYLLSQDGSQFSGTLRRLADSVIARPKDFANFTPAAQARTPANMTPVNRTPANTPPAQTDATPVQAGKSTASPADAKAEPQPLDIKVVQTVAVEPPSAKQESAGVASAAIMPVAAAPQAEADHAPAAPVGPPLAIAPNDPKVFRERGIFAYRSGDLDGAISEFDRAIQLDPKFSAAYIDRGIALYRLQKFERAFADIAQAKRIEKANRARAAAQAGKKSRPQAAVALGFPLFQHRTAKLE